MKDFLWAAYDWTAIYLGLAFGVLVLLIFLPFVLALVIITDPFSYPWEWIKMTGRAYRTMLWSPTYDDISMTELLDKD